MAQVFQQTPMGRIPRRVPWHPNLHALVGIGEIHAQVRAHALAHTFAERTLGGTM